MALTNGNPLIDAETTLVGWTNRSAIRNSEHTFLSGEEVLLNTKLDAASRFSLVASHPGAPAAVEVELLLAPVLRDGTTGSWISAVRVPYRQKAAGWRHFFPAMTSRSHRRICPTSICRRCVSPRRS